MFPNDNPKLNRFAFDVWVVENGERTHHHSLVTFSTYEWTMLSANYLNLKDQQMYKNNEGKSGSSSITKNMSATSKRLFELRKSVDSLQKEVQSRVFQWSTKPDASPHRYYSSRDASLEIAEILFSNASPKDRLDYVESKINEIQQEMEQIRVSLVVEPNESDDSLFEEDISDKDDNMKELQQRCIFLQNCQQVVTVLEQINRNRGQHSTSFEAVSLLAEQAKDLQTAKTLIQKCAQEDTNDDNAPKKHYNNNILVLKELKTRVSDLHSSIKQDAVDIIQKTIVMKQNNELQVLKKSNMRETATTTDAASKLRDAWDCLLVLSSQDEERQKTDIDVVLWEVASSLMNLILNPLVEKASNKLVDVEQGTENNEKIMFIRWKTTQEGNIHDFILQWNSLLFAIQSIFTFFYHHALDEKPMLATNIGKLLLSDPSTTTTNIIATITAHQSLLQLSLLLRQFFWDHCIPIKDGAKMISTTDYSLLLQSTASLQDTLQKCHFLDQKEEWFLTAFVKDYPTRYCEKKRNNVLSQARFIMTHMDYHSTIQTGEDSLQNENESLTEEQKELNRYMSVFTFPKCSISIVANELLKLIRETMKEATAEDTAAACSQQLYRAARECLDIFRAVIPSINRQDLQTLPRLAAIFHNDCIYLAHACTTLGLEFPVKGTAICTFVDMVPVFRELGNGAMMDMLKRQRHELIMIISPERIIDGLEKSLRMNESGVAWSEAETAVRGSQHHLNLIARAWRGNLPKDVYARAMGSLVDVLLCLFLRPVLQADDISEAASQFIGSLYRSVQLHCADLFDRNDIIANFCTSWDRFKTVGDILQMNLTDIQDGLSIGKFVNITAAELSHLILSTFDDSEKRRNLLHALAAQE